MDRSQDRYRKSQLVAGLFALAAVLPAAGCHTLLATGVYLFQGGNMAPAECEALKGERVVVVCRPPSSNEYRYAGASQSVALRVSELLAKNVKGIDVVSPRDVDNWVDEKDWGDFRELAKAVRADLVVHIKLDDFELFKGRTLYQGQADVTVSVHDMRERGKTVWERQIGQVLYPVNSGIPAQDKPVQQFERDFVGIVSDRIAENFYAHDPYSAFAIDATANR